MEYVTFAEEFERVEPLKARRFNSMASVVTLQLGLRQDEINLLTDSCPFFKALLRDSHPFLRPF